MSDVTSLHKLSEILETDSFDLNFVDYSLHNGTGLVALELIRLSPRNCTTTNTDALKISCNQTWITLSPCKSRKAIQPFVLPNSKRPRVKLAKALNRLRRSNRIHWLALMRNDDPQPFSLNEKRTLDTAEGPSSFWQFSGKKNAAYVLSSVKLQPSTRRPDRFSPS